MMRKRFAGVVLVTSVIAGVAAGVGASALTSDNPSAAPTARPTNEVDIGQTITATFRFPSGDVVAKFTVVQGNTDGTIAS
jgi:hypothetical protein